MNIYLAGPYSHPDAETREARFNELNSVAARLMESGYTVFSPISHSHPIADHLPDERRCSWEFWRGQDFPLLEWADALVVYTMDGWEESVGVQAEIAHAEKLGKPVHHLDPDPLYGLRMFFKGDVGALVDELGGYGDLEDAP